MQARAAASAFCWLKKEKKKNEWVKYLTEIPCYKLKSLKCFYIRKKKKKKINKLARKKEKE